MDGKRVMILGGDDAVSVAHPSLSQTPCLDNETEEQRNHRNRIEHERELRVQIVTKLALTAQDHAAFQADVKRKEHLLEQDERKLMWDEDVHPPPPVDIFIDLIGPTVRQGTRPVKDQEPHKIQGDTTIGVCWDAGRHEEVGGGTEAKEAIYLLFMSMPSENRPLHRATKSKDMSSLAQKRKDRRTNQALAAGRAGGHSAGSGETKSKAKVEYRDEKERKMFAKWGKMSRLELREEMQWYGIVGKILFDKNRVLQTRKLVETYRTRYELVYQGPLRKFVVDSLVPEGELAVLRKEASFGNIQRHRKIYEHERAQGFYYRSFYVKYYDERAHVFNPKYGKSVTVTSQRGPTTTLCCTLGSDASALLDFAKNHLKHSRAEREARDKKQLDKAEKNKEATKSILGNIKNASRKFQ
jgi:hypothetical protein